MSIVNITTTSDADFFRGFAYQDTLGVPIDLTGNTMRMGVRRNADDVSEVLLLTTDSGGGLTITDAPNGKFSVWITQDQLLHLSPAQYVHSLIRTRPDGMQLKIWEGSLTNAAGPSR